MNDIIKTTPLEVFHNRVTVTLPRDSIEFILLTVYGSDIKLDYRLKDVIFHIKEGT